MYAIPNDPQAERLLKQFERVDVTPEQAQLCQEIRQVYINAALAVAKLVPGSPERTVALRKLLESKDCAVRAAVLPQT